jgi:hypothetical protein
MGLSSVVVAATFWMVLYAMGYHRSPSLEITAILLVAAVPTFIFMALLVRAFQPRHGGSARLRDLVVALFFALVTLFAVGLLFRGSDDVGSPLFTLDLESVPWLLAYAVGGFVLQRALRRAGKSAERVGRPGVFHSRESGSR